MTAIAVSESDASDVGRRATRELRGIWLQPPSAMALTKAQRRAALRALLPGGTVASEHRATTAQVARHLRGYRWAPWLFIVVGAVCGASFLITESPACWLSATAALVGFGFAGVYGFALHRARAIVVDEFGG